LRLDGVIQTAECALVSDIKQRVESWVRTAALAALGPAGDVDPQIRAAKDERFGDYQANLAMGLGKALGRSPRDIANAVAVALQSSESAPHLEQVEVAGPGFINLKLSRQAVARALVDMARSERLGVEQCTTPQTVVVDYCGVNLAKEMHIGHLRSTIIGDSIARILEFRGDRVIRQNHTGDWGTQFGMLLEHLIDTAWNAEGNHAIGDLNDLYKAAKARFDAEPAFADRSRARVVALQAGEPRAMELWRKLIDESVKHMDEVCAALGVKLTHEDIRPESFYNDSLVPLVNELRAKGILVEDHGAQVVFCEGFNNKEGQPLPLIVQKSDTGFGYAATDLAAGKYRIQTLGANRVVYVVDARQSDHFTQVFWVLRKAGIAPKESVSLEHTAFGMILGKDKKPFKTRAGDSVRLASVLAEAEERATAIINHKVESRGGTLSPAERADIGRAVGIGALKYADLSSERIKDYVFDWDRMLAFEGNTAPYLQNAYVRIRSIFRKGEASFEAAASATIAIEQPEERRLAMQLLQLPQIVDGVASSLEPHRLCNYLCDLATSFHGFYEHCRVLNADNDDIKQSRLALSALVARTLQLGLNLLGIPVIEQM
jgi:arginyl-tRNA synthetase